MPGRRTIQWAAMAAAVALTTGGPVALASAATHDGARPEAQVAAHTSHRDRPGSMTAAQREVIREATARYRNVDTAVRAGYVPTDVCVADPTLGGMGYHYVNPGLAANPNVDPTRPEILVYARDHDGPLRLAAIEYFKADADGDLRTDEDRPTLFGELFDGPMPGHEPGQPVHYDRHAWVWLPNPVGELAQYNPLVTCPEPKP
ncbi:hypothetical protein SAMN05421678_12317 [Actinopolymorpha cephalotaxi]|uniref:Uncharacterized protein n=1 Tax=Actinopolymorpha cephalotaxi TaxID=504797 RepID=A0A1I3BBM8_9ACTN|nr:hypothetical protein [Actinopolymorpha cephalotaxi]NYH86805.1 hypothetical protein [Actinopolymorpha cephalotaxi]SFH59091.1 hypothetical protein SAMN05421678_12317 [Actinopolymorpha cephalotaxi]